MPILDGAAKASVLPPEIVGLMSRFGDSLSAAAVEHQSETGAELDSLVGIALETEDGRVTAGLVSTRAIDDAFFEVMDDDPSQQERMRAFLQRPVPPTHLRAIFASPRGVALIRIDVMAPPKGGEA